MTPRENNQVMLLVILMPCESKDANLPKYLYISLFVYFRLLANRGSLQGQKRRQLKRDRYKSRNYKQVCSRFVECKMPLVSAPECWH